jgi:hypothetical protein
MTYSEYYAKLLKDLNDSEKFIEQKYKELKGDKGFLEKEEREAYMDLQNDLTSLMSKCDRLSHLISNKEVKPKDNVNPDVLGFLPTDIPE